MLWVPESGSPISLLPSATLPGPRFPETQDFLRFPTRPPGVSFRFRFLPFPGSGSGLLPLRFRSFHDFTVIPDNQHPALRSPMNSQRQPSARGWRAAHRGAPSSLQGEAQNSRPVALASTRKTGPWQYWTTFPTGSQVVKELRPLVPLPVSLWFGSYAW